MPKSQNPIVIPFEPAQANTCAKKADRMDPPFLLPGG